MDWNLGRASQRSKDLKFGRASQRSDGLESWTCFPEVQRLNLDVLPRGPMELDLDVLPRGPLKLNFGRAFQRSKDLKFERAS